MEYSNSYIGSEEYAKYSSLINKNFKELSQYAGTKDEKTFELLPKAKILIFLWKILGNIFKIPDSDAVDESKLDLRFYSVEVTEKLNECIKTFINQKYGEKGQAFSEYLIKIEIQNIFRLYKSGHQITDSLGLANFNKKKVFQIKRYYNESTSYGLSHEEAINRVAQLCSVTEEQAEEYLERSLIQGVSNDFSADNNAEDFSNSVLDIACSMMYQKNGMEEKFIACSDFDLLLDSIQYCWEKNVKVTDQKCVSELLTVFFLKPFSQGESNMQNAVSGQQNGGSLSLFNYFQVCMNYDWAAADKKYSFLDKEIINDFPDDIKTLSRIAKKNNITKMNANAKLKRVLELAKGRFKSTQSK